MWTLTHSSGQPIPVEILATTLKKQRRITFIPSLDLGLAEYNIFSRIDATKRCPFLSLFVSLFHTAGRVRPSSVVAAEEARSFHFVLNDLL